MQRRFATAGGVRCSICGECGSAAAAQCSYLLPTQPEAAPPPLAAGRDTSAASCWGGDSAATRVARWGDRRPRVRAILLGSADAPRSPLPRLTVPPAAHALLPLARGGCRQISHARILIFADMSHVPFSCCPQDHFASFSLICPHFPHKSPDSVPDNQRLLGGILTLTSCSIETSVSPFCRHLFDSSSSARLRDRSNLSTTRSSATRPLQTLSSRSSTARWYSLRVGVRRSLRRRSILPSTRNGKGSSRRHSADIKRSSA